MRHWKWLTLALCAALLFGCTAPAAQMPPAASAASAGEAPAPAALPADGLRMALLLDGPARDGGWNADCYTGLLQARDILGYTVAVEENLRPDELEPAFRRYAEDGYHLIIAPGAQYESAVAAIYREYPASHFAGIHFSFTAANVTSLNFNDTQAGFLAGAFAGLHTRTQSVGYIGGDEIPSTTNAMLGMGQGIKYVRENVQYTASTTGAWNDPAKACALAEDQISSQNVDVIFANGSGCNPGVVAAAKGKIACIVMACADTPPSDADTIRCTIVGSNSAMILFAAQQLAGGQAGTALVGDVSNGVIRIGAFSAGVDASIIAELNKIYRDIITGNIIPA